MISASHTITTIGGWLRSVRIFLIKELKRWPVFDSIVTDFSYANINSIMMEFNQMTIPEYLIMTHNWISDKPSIKSENEVTKMYLCCAHLMHIIATDVNKIYGANSAHGKIVIEVIASIFNTPSYETIKEIFKHLCVLLKNKFYTDEVSKSIDILLKLIVRSEIDQLLELATNYQSNDIVDNVSSKPDPLLGILYKAALYEQSPYYADLKIILDDVKSSDSGSEPNPYYGESFLNKFLKNKMAFLPWWSGIINKTVQRACNSHVESYFKAIKSTVRENKHTIGRMPTKALRVLKVIRKRNLLIHKQVKHSIPKRRLAMRAKKTKSIKNKLPTRDSSFSFSDGNSSCSNTSITSIFESKDTEKIYPRFTELQMTSFILDQGIHSSLIPDSRAEFRPFAPKAIPTICRLYYAFYKCYDSELLLKNLPTSCANP